MPVTPRDKEAGFTMIATVLAMAAMMLLAVVAVAAVRSDTHLSQRDLEGKQAYEAAKAGIDEYAYQLNADSAYWAKCTNVDEPSAINQKGSTAKRRPVPGDTGAEYAIELIPAEGQSSCDPSTVIAAEKTMLETGEHLAGSFRIRSTGFSGKAKASIVATFKPPSFLDYVYFTQRETSDPVTYIEDASDPTEALEAVTAQCSKTWEEGRYDQQFRFKTGSGSYKSEKCDMIQFISEDTINGSLRTNDAMYICGRPTFGRSSSDMIEVGAKTPSDHPGWYGAGCGDEPNFVGTYEYGVPPLEPPETNVELKSIAEAGGYTYEGQVQICLKGDEMSVSTVGFSCSSEYKRLQGNGVVYVKKKGTCTGTYSPFGVGYPTRSECGDVYVKDASSSGSYSGRLTIAAEGDVVIDGNLERSGNGMLGLIANKFVRVYHPVEMSHPRECVRYSYNWHGHKECAEYGENLEVSECDSRSRNANGSLYNPTIDAAILAIEHSFIVDNYNCGGSLGTLTVEGAIAQDYRGAVGTSGNTGYAKNYNYDDRLRYSEPPSFINPKSQSWVIGRETTE